MEESLESNIQSADPSTDRVEENNVEFWKPSNDGSNITVVLADPNRPDVIELTLKPKDAAQIPENLDELRVRVQTKESADSSFKPYPKVSLDAA